MSEHDDFADSTAVAPTSFGARLTETVRQRGAACLGIDPHTRLMLEWGLADDLVSLERFSLTCVEALGDLAPVLKPQSAFFERFGSRGIAVLERTIAGARAAGALVLADVKRGDIGSTMQAYAQAYLDPSSDLAVDAITLSPYLGLGSLEPAFGMANRHGAGVFVLAMTSNKEAGEVQQARRPDGRTVAQAVLDELAGRNAGQRPLGSFGVVVGATGQQQPVDLTKLNGPILVPGIGAQGGTVADVRRLLSGVGDASSDSPVGQTSDGAGHPVGERTSAGVPLLLPSASRSVLAAGPSVAGLRSAAQRYLDEYGRLTG